MKDLIEETIGKIKKLGIKPEPRWKYLVKKYGIWGVFGIVMLFGAVSFSVAFDLLSQLDWDLYRFTRQSALAYSLTLLPYFWIMLIGMFLFLAFFDMRKTENGYKYGWLKMSAASIGGIIAIGLILYFAGLGGKFNSVLSRDIPYYGKHLIVTKEVQWMRPDDGFLSGSLTSVSSDSLGMIDLKGQKWTIFLNEDTLIRPMADIRQGEMIKVIGSKKSADSFQAFEVRPWMGKGAGGHPGGGQNKGMGGNGRGMMMDN